MRETKKAAKRLAKTLRARNGGAVLVDGVMGAGKTTFISFVIGYLDKRLRPTSPTFQIINKYSEHIYHADLYRLDGGDPADVGLYDLIADGNYVFIEWAVGVGIPNAIRVKINVGEGGKREITID